MALLTCSVKAEAPEKSVVHIKCFSQLPVWGAPWRFNNVRQSSGTGFVISGRQIMTNAHVVSWAREIIVKRYQDPRSYRARVSYIGHDCDLALLSVEDPRFFDDIEPLKFGKLPDVRSEVVTYGYPAGGRQISFTRGVVSRIEMQSYAHIGNRMYLGVQTDAAINPGNSGGPVIQSEHVVGVAFQGIKRLENTGFFIPPAVINHFLKDVEDLKYDGFPTLSFTMTPLENPAYRRYLKLPNDGRGVLISAFLPQTRNDDLKLDDVLLRAGGHEVGSDGTILLKGNRVHVGTIFDDVQHGETVPISIWRDGKTIDLSVPVYVYNVDKSAGYQYDTLPRYRVYAGLVFVPLSRDYLRSIDKRLGLTQYPNLFHELFRRHDEKRIDEEQISLREEPVILARVLPHPVNADMTITSGVMVDSINGVRINRLEDIEPALVSSRDGFHRIVFAHSSAVEALSKEAADKAHKEILDTYSITEDKRW